VQRIRRMATAAAVLAGMMSAAVLTVAAPAQAKKYVYSPIVEETEKEVEYYVDWREKPDGTTVVGHELEFEYGFAPKDAISFYGVWEQASGEDVQFLKYKVEWIHQVFEQGERAWDFATYFEYQIADKGGADKVEFKTLFERALGGNLLTLNGIFEKQIGENAADGTEFGCEWTQKALEEARIDDAARYAIRHGNAARFLGHLATLAPYQEAAE